VSQIRRSTIAQPVRVERGNPHIGAAILAMAMVAALMGGIVILRSSTTTPAVTIPAAHQQLVDGWLPAANAAGAARLERVQDGYLPGLVNPRQGSDLADGYLGGLIAARTTGDLVDGWMPAFSGRGQGVDLRDGWESALMR
jgi:hypothetical protein